MKAESGHILIVDDEPANLKLLNRMLSSQGYKNNILIQDPREVLARYHEQRTDLILLDINMPDLDGFEVMQQLMDLNDPIMPPIIILTAQNDREYRIRALNSGARDFLSKPFDRTELLARVRNLLEAHMAHRMVYDQKDVLDELVKQRTEELQKSQLQVVQRLGMAAEYHDENTGKHLKRMSRISYILAQGLGWSRADSELILNASPMHDIGKIGIPDNILRKKGKLEAHEWNIMKTHSIIGGELLKDDDSKLMKMAREIALTHHEKWDGSGYPKGLAGNEIPISGRIAALADVYDALTSSRPYKNAWSAEQAVELIKRKSGEYFDPELVGILLQNRSEIEQVCARNEQSIDTGSADKLLKYAYN